MSNESKKAFKAFAKYLLLAQAASDAGKGYISSKASNAAKALEAGYALKDEYIKQALREVKRLPRGLVEVGSTYDPNFDMAVILFNIKGYGQVSFHSFNEHFEFRGKQNGVEWNGIRGGSIMTCRKLARNLKLPHYKG